MSTTSSRIPSLLDAHLPHDADGAWYRAPAIPAKKLSNAIGQYAGDASQTSVLALADGTVFGSAKEGIVITADTLYSRTIEATFSVPLQEILGAKVVGGWPGYVVELQSRDGSTHRISMACFAKKQAALVDFLSALAAAQDKPVSRHKPRRAAPSQQLAGGGVQPTMPASPAAPRPHETTNTSIASINSGLRLINVCQQEQVDDVGTLFEMAFATDAEQPLIHGYCRYVGFNGREVDGVFLLSNQRLLLFSMESGAKIVLVELTKRLLGKLPVPFVDSVVNFLLFSIPRTAYVALRGGKESLIAQALAFDEAQLLSNQPPLRKVQDYELTRFQENVAQVDIGTGVWTGFLARKFGVSFSPSGLSKSFSVPSDLILPEYETLESFERLLSAIRPTLLRLGLDYHTQTDQQKLSIGPTAAKAKAAA